MTSILDENRERWNAQLVAMGSIIRQAAMMDRALEVALCALVGSKYAAVLASGRNTSELISDCRELVKVHTDLMPVGQAAVTEALSACKAASEQRNQLVHSIMSAFGNETVVAAKAVRRSHKITVREWTIAELYEVARALVEAESGLNRAIWLHMGDEAMGLWEQLRIEDMLLDESQ